MKVICFLFFLTVIVSSSYAQVKDTIHDEKIYYSVEEPAEFPVGRDAFVKFLQDNISYPPKAVKDKIRGKVFVKFIIEKDGSLSNIEVLKGVSPELDEEAVRVISKSPAWLPGKQNGKPIRSQFVLPVHFFNPKKNKKSHGKN